MICHECWPVDSMDVTKGIELCPAHELTERLAGTLRGMLISRSFRLLELETVVDEYDRAANE